MHLQVYAAGVKNIDLNFIITEVAGPYILILSLSVVLPYVLAQALISIPGNGHCIIDMLNYLLYSAGMSHPMQHTVVRTIYPSIALIIIFAGLIYSMIKQCRKMYQKVKNDK